MTDTMVRVNSMLRADGLPMMVLGATESTTARAHFTMMMAPNARKVTSSMKKSAMT